MKYLAQVHALVSCDPDVNLSQPGPDASSPPTQVLPPNGKGHNSTNGLSKMLTYTGGDLDDRCPSSKFFCLFIRV